MTLVAQVFDRLRPVRRVLLILGDKAWWSRWQAGRCLDWEGASLADGMPGFADIVDRQGLRIVIDDASPDIERLASSGFGAHPLGRWQRFRFAKQRQRETADTTIGWLGRHASQVARAALHRDAACADLPAQIDALLSERDAVSGVTTTERLVASTRARGASPCFIVQRHAGVERHLLIIDGIACFARRVVLDVDDTVVAIATSLDHALDRWALDSLELRLEGNACDDQTRLVALDRLPGVARVVCVRTPVVDADDLPRRLASLAARGRRNGCAPAHWHFLLSRWRSRRERRLSSAIVALTLVVALGAATHAMTIGREHARQAGLLGIERTSVLSELERVRAEAASLHAEPDRAARFLERFSQLTIAAPPTPDGVLDAVAGAFELHPAMVLDSLAWVRSAVPVAGSDVASILFTDSGAIPARGAGMVLELAGRVERSTPLRDAQRQSVALTGELGRHGGISACRLVDSPLARAAEGRPAAGSPGRIAVTVGSAADNDIDWRIQCDLSVGANGVPG